MNHKVNLLDDDDYNLDDDIAPEYDFSTMRRDPERERRFRLQALTRLQKDEQRLARLREHPEEAVKLLRLALADAETEPRILPLAIQAVSIARGNLGGLELSREEALKMVDVLNQYIKQQLPQAA